MIYTTAPSERLGMMKHIISHIPADAGLRNILIDPTLLKEKRRSDGRENIARAANAYVKKFFGVSIQTYVQRVREGAEIEDVEILRQAVEVRKAVTAKRLRVLQDHKGRELSEGEQEIIDAMRVAADEAREANPQLHDKLHLRADVKQANMVTDDDVERVSTIVDEAQAAVDAFLLGLMQQAAAA